MRANNEWFKELPLFLKGLIIGGIILDLAIYALAGSFAASTWSEIQTLRKPARAVIAPKNEPQPKREATREPQVENLEEETTMVLRVIDGDTVEVEGGREVRYIGIDCPEEGEEYSREATVKNKELVEGRVVSLVKDVSEKDMFGRLLRYVYVGDVFVNAKLVEEGLAEATPYPPDIAHEDEFAELETKARDERKAIWKSFAQQSDSAGPVPFDVQQGQQVMVYINEPGIDYHIPTCDRVGSGSKPVYLSIAKASGFMPCDLCNPPR